MHQEIAESSEPDGAGGERRMIWPKVAIDHEMQAALKIAIHTLRRMDDIVFRDVIQQLEFMVEWDG